MSLLQGIFSRIYRQAKEPTALPWHRAEPPALLRQVLGQRPRGRALDVGCGEGVAAVFLAQRGYQVTALDFAAEAVAWTRERARAAGVALQVEQRDVLSYSAAAPFDLVLDSGCLHHIPPWGLSRYRQRLEQWLAPGGDYLLVHFAKRHLLDWRPVSPRRRSARQLARFFPTLKLVAEDQTSFDNLPLLIGPTAVAGVYWFQRR